MRKGKGKGLKVKGKERCPLNGSGLKSCLAWWEPSPLTGIRCVISVVSISTDSGRSCLVLSCLVLLFVVSSLFLP